MNVQLTWNWIAENSNKTIRETITKNPNQCLESLISELKNENCCLITKNQTNKVIKCLKKANGDPKILDTFFETLKRHQLLDENRCNDFLNRMWKNEPLAVALLSHSNFPIRIDRVGFLIEQALEKSCFQIAEELGKRRFHPAEVTYNDSKTKNTALHICAEEGLINVAKQLVDRYPIHISQLNQDGKTPYEIAKEKQNQEMTELFRQYVGK